MRLDGAQFAAAVCLWALCSGGTVVGLPSDTCPRVGHAAVHLFNLTGQPDANVLSNFRMMLNLNNQELHSEQYRQEMMERVQDDNERFFAALESSPEELAGEDKHARDVHAALTQASHVSRLNAVRILMGGPTECRIL